MNESCSLSIENTTLEYILKVSKVSRKLRIAVHGDGRCVVTAPHRASHTIIERFISEKAHWIFKKKEFFKKRQGVQILKSDTETYKKHRHQALEIITKKITQFNAIYRFPFTRISIRNQKSRWGSCSRCGNLNFNVKVALIPESLVEYVVAHELCHLQELNHSRAFWDLVSRTIPDYMSRRRELKKFCIIK